MMWEPKFCKGIKAAMGWGGWVRRTKLAEGPVFNLQEVNQ